MKTNPIISLNSTRSIWDQNFESYPNLIAIFNVEDLLISMQLFLDTIYRHGYDKEW